MIKLAGLSDEEVKNVTAQGTILLGYRGSIAHGMYVPNTDPNSIDDKDLLGVCIPPERFYYGLNKFEQKEAFYKEWDAVTYEVRKFVKLLIQQNPNVLGMLWLEPQHYIYMTAEGKHLLNNRDLFVGRSAYHSFTGYAYSQLKRMTAQVFEGYMGEKRKRLVEKFGYDAKNAAHLIRLLRMGIEYLNEGVMYVDRGKVGDATQLLSIKRGEWKIEEVKAEADRLFKRAEEAYDRCKLPQKLDTKAIDELVVSIVKARLEADEVLK